MNTNPADDPRPISERSLAELAAEAAAMHPADEPADDPFAGKTIEELLAEAGKTDPVPPEDLERYCRTLREWYLALVHQNFAEDQALTLVGSMLIQSFNAALAQRAEDERRKRGDL